MFTQGSVQGGHTYPGGHTKGFILQNKRYRGKEVKKRHLQLKVVHNHIYFVQFGKLKDCEQR